MNYILIFLIFLGFIAFAFTLAYFSKRNKEIKNEMKHWYDAKFWNDIINKSKQD